MNKIGGPTISDLNSVILWWTIVIWSPRILVVINDSFLVNRSWFSQLLNDVDGKCISLEDILIFECIKKRYYEFLSPLETNTSVNITLGLLRPLFSQERKLPCDNWYLKILVLNWQQLQHPLCEKLVHYSICYLKFNPSVFPLHSLCRSTSNWCQLYTLSYLRTVVKLPVTILNARSSSITFSCDRACTWCNSR